MDSGFIFLEDFAYNIIIKSKAEKKGENFMGYDIFQFGSLCLDNTAMDVPQNPFCGGNGDVPLYYGDTSISIKQTTRAKAITWVKPHGLNLFIADRVLLTRANWDVLNKNGFVKGKEIVINGHYFRCRLPYVGENQMAQNEWNMALTIAGEEDSLWNCLNMYFWGAESFMDNPTFRVVRGWFSARYFGWSKPNNLNIGFRPVLEPLGSVVGVPNCKLDGTDFRFGSIPGGEGFCPILQPVGRNVFTDIPDGSQVEMYTLVEDGQPVHADDGFKNAAKLTLTDRYFGDEYLVHWVISNGVAVASQSLLPCERRGVIT